MEIVWTVTLETDTPGDPAELQHEADRVRLLLEDTALSVLGHLIGDDGSCEATVRIDP